MTTQMFLLAILQLLISSASGCLIIEGKYQRLSMEQTLHDAPAVVIATDVFHSITPGEAFTESEENYAIFSVDCIMKSGGYTIGRNISIYEGATRQDAACHATIPEVGTKYVIGLEMQPSLSTESFFIYEPNPLTPGGFEATEDILQAAVMVCGLQDSQAVGAGDALCPLPNEDEDCGTGRGTHMASSLASLGLSIAVVLAAH